MHFALGEEFQYRDSLRVLTVLIAIKLFSLRSRLYS